MAPRSDAEYLQFNPFDEGKGDCRIECRKVQIVTIRKEQPCAASYIAPPDYRFHFIRANNRAVKESAKVDGQFGSCYSCLPCFDALMDWQHST